MDPHFWEREGSKGSAMAPFKRVMAASYMPSIVTAALSLTIRPQFAIKCLRRLNKQLVGHYEAKIGEEGADRPHVSKSLINTIWETHVDVVCERNRVVIFCRLSTMYERDGQTDRRTDHGMVTSTTIIGQIACHKSRVLYRHNLYAIKARIPDRYRNKAIVNSITTYIAMSCCDVFCQ